MVALKILPPEAGDATFAERFMREARTLARLDHPGIVRLHDFGEVPLSAPLPSGESGWVEGEAWAVSTPSG